MDKEIIKVNYVFNDCNKEGFIELIENDDDTVELIFKSEDECIQSEGINYFETLINIRKILEKKKIKLLCQGCAKDVYPSAMMLNMGLGRKAYKLVMGIQATSKSIVDIFDSCEFEKYGTIKQQKKFFNDWTNSI